MERKYEGLLLKLTLSLFQIGPIDRSIGVRVVTSVQLLKQKLTMFLSAMKHVTPVCAVKLGTHELDDKQDAIEDSNESKEYFETSWLEVLRTNRRKPGPKDATQKSERSNVPGNAA